MQALHTPIQLIIIAYMSLAISVTVMRFIQSTKLLYAGLD